MAHGDCKAKAGVGETMPVLPPVFREFCQSAPKDFVYPTIVALMPIMGTLTSYLRSRYMDRKEHSTTFFNVLYAPPSSSKGFCEFLMEPLFSIINQRDEIAAMRAQIYLNAKSAKGANEKDPVDPHTSKRIMEAINSQPEFLTQMRDNKGYHMFTMAEEVDTFNKGSKAGGTDKSDMFRCAFDNSYYGQSFKSASTFKGRVRIYYNILLTGTPDQVLKYYSNVEDGMITRVSFCAIENQRFASMPKWKMLSKKAMDTIMAFVRRCDDNTYCEPLDFSPEDAYQIEDKDFDSIVPWRYTFRPFQLVDMSWTFTWINKWLEKERKKASLAEDDARDTFRRRCAVKGFRLAMVCIACWKKVGKREQQVIKDFVLWWMDRDLENSLLLFGDKYNEVQRNSVIRRIRNAPDLYASLPQLFDKKLLIEQAMKLGIKSPACLITSRWYKEKAIKRLGDEKYEKINENKLIK